MNAPRWIQIALFSATAAAFSGIVSGNETELNPKNDHPTITGNSAAQLGPTGTATPRRRGDSKHQRSTANPAAQMGAGVNANAAAQLNNETKAASEPPAVDSNTDSATTTK